jgi:hypothetical protein
MSSRVLKSGLGWRVGWNPDAEIFQGLVGTEDWAIELTESELNDLCRLAEQLATTMQAMALELMDEEAITLEAESDRIWLQVEGVPQHYDLRLILNQQRKVEGYWPASAVPEFLRALAAVKIW